MKKFKKPIAIALSLVLCLALSVAAFAADATGLASQTSNITVSGLETAQATTVNGYQIMTVDVDGQGFPKNPTYFWAQGLRSWIASNYASYIDASTGAVTEAFSNVASDSGNGTLANFYDDLANAIRNDQASAASIKSATDTQKTGSVTLSDVSIGNWMLLVEGGNKVYKVSTCSILPQFNKDNNKWELSTPSVVLKSSEPTIVKTVNDKAAENYSIGDSMPFVIEADVPSFPADAIHKTYKISDTATGMDLVASSVKVYGVAAGGQKTQLTVNEDYTATLPDSRHATVDFVYDNIASYSKIRIEYNAILAKDANIATTANPNEAKLTYTNNPYSVQDSTVDKTSTPNVYTYELDVTKLDAKDSTKKLEGAEFTLNNGTANLKFVKQGDAYVVDATGSETLVSDANGLIKIKGLDAGSYTLTETKAPAGYNLPANNTTSVVIKDDNCDGSVENAQGAEQNTGIVNASITNSQGFSLPQTGSNGEIILSIVAGLFVIAAGVFFVMGRKKNSAEG